MAEPFVYRGGAHRDNAPLGQWPAGQEPEPVPEPDLPIMDPHHHFWDARIYSIDG
jgi:L-fuconolactonase